MDALYWDVPFTDCVLFVQSTGMRFPSVMGLPASRSSVLHVDTDDAIYEGLGGGSPNGAEDDQPDYDNEYAGLAIVSMDGDSKDEGTPSWED